MFETYSHFLLETKRGWQLSLGALGLASLLAIYNFFGMFCAWYSDYALTHAPQAVASDQSVDLSLQRIAQIPEQHVFGISPIEDTDFLPITTLQVHLTGTATATDKQESTALISQSGKLSRVYRVGDELTSGISINAINADSVVLEHNGHLEKLPLDRAPLIFQDLPTPLWQNPE